MVPEGLGPLTEFLLYVGSLASLILAAGVIGYGSGRRRAVHDPSWYAELEKLRLASVRLIGLSREGRQGISSGPGIGSGAVQGFPTTAILLELMGERRAVCSRYGVPEVSEELFEHGIIAMFAPDECYLSASRVRSAIRFVEKQVRRNALRRQGQGGK